MVDLLVDNRVRVLLADLSDECVTELHEEFTHKNPEYGAKKAIGVSTWNIPRSITTFQDVDGFLTFPRGGYRRVLRILERNDVDVRSVDKRWKGAADLHGEIPAHRLRLYQYQREAVASAMHKQNCLIRAPTGSGKTCLGFGLISAINIPSLLVMLPTTALLRQWIKRADKELGLKPRDLGIIRGAKNTLRPVTLALPQTIAAHGVTDEMNDYFGLVLCDEAQLFAARTFFEAVDPWRAHYRVAVSADHRRKDRKEFLVEDLFGDVAHETKQKTLIASGHVLDVQIRVVPTEFRAPWYGMADADDKNDEREIDFGRLLVAMGEDADRNALIRNIIMREVEAGKQVLAFTHRREMCMRIDRELAARGVRTGFLIGSDDYRVEFEKTIDGLERIDRLRCDVGVGTYKGSGTGIDLPAVGVGIATTPIAGNKQFFGQVRGRLCRAPEGKTEAVLYYLWDRAVYGLKHLRNLNAWNANVVVWNGSEWVVAKQFIRAMHAA